MGRSSLAQKGEPLWCDPTMVFPRLLVNVLEQEVVGSDNEDEEDEDEIEDYSTDSDSDECISDDD